MLDTQINVLNNDEKSPHLISDKFKRYFQFLLLLLAAGAIYPLLYLRQNFETPILQAFNITTKDLSNYYSMLGVMYFVCYLPSGWLADRFTPRLLVTISMVGTGCLGLWFATIPSKDLLVYIFMSWGLFAGLTFWASMIKGVKILAKANEQGRFFGVLDGGRGLVEAVLATAAISIFAYVMGKYSDNTLALKEVIYMYSYFCIAVGILVFLFLKTNEVKKSSDKKITGTGSLLRDLKTLLSIPEVWIVSIIILCGYQLFWATYSFSAFMQKDYDISTVTAGFITVAKLWMRPIGGVGAGFLGDKFGKENTLALAMALASVGLLMMIFMPQLNTVYALLAIVLVIGVMTYAVRGLYWSILENCNIPLHVTGLAIGVISLIAYTPDIFLPQIYRLIASYYQGITVYNIYFGYISIVGFVGVFSALQLRNMTTRKRIQA